MGLAHQAGEGHPAPDPERPEIRRVDLIRRGPGLLGAQLLRAGQGRGSYSFSVC